MSKAPQDWLSITDTAKYLGLSRPTIHRYIEEGRFPAYRLGYRTVRIRLADIERYIESTRVVTL